ncbi:hypothetical protein AVEN_185486-1 [Araneus ventricosus]|uniref:DUF4806 domain-containing protein n=1 Tax=Araneus ventricosus TaxID=182803 RepID=A0A4Y2GWJ5_ARAVE|nr:hypothetical protein AVEN_185486-1 [Araneus ventricosus]
MLNEKLIEDYLDYAEELLCYFVKHRKTLYGEEFVVYNVHSLVHLAEDVRRFHVVKFPDENSVTVVPCSWVDGDMCAWPPFKSLKRIEDCVKNLRDPDPSWQRIRVLIMKSTDSYDKAVKLEERAVFTSDLNSEKEDVEELSRRKRKRPVVNRDSSSEDEVQHLPPFPQIVHHSLPEVSSFSGQTQVVLQQPPFHEQHSMASYVPLNRQLPASPKDIKDGSFQRKVLRLLESIQQDIKELKDSKLNSRGSIPRLPPGCPQLPCESPEDLLNLEGLLKDENMFRNICDFVSSIGGNSIKDCTKSILGKLLSTNLSLKYNWKGTRGIKLGFAALNLINKLIFGAVRNNGMFSAATEVEIQEITKRWLMHAKDRDGGRNLRASLIQINS